MAKGGGSSGPTLQKYEYEFQDESNNTINDFNKSFETVDLVIKGIYDDNTISEKGRYRLSPTKGKIWINSAEIFYMENLDISVKQEVGSVVINNKEVSASTVYRVNNKDRIEIDLNPDQSLSFTFLQDSEAPTIEYTGVESKILKNGNKLSFRISDNYSNISLLCSDENVDIEEFINNQKNLPTRNSIDDKSVELVLGNNRRINKCFFIH